MIRIAKVKFLFFQNKKRQLYTTLTEETAPFCQKQCRQSISRRSRAEPLPFHFSIRDVITYAAAKLMSNPIR